MPGLINCPDNRRELRILNFISCLVLFVVIVVVLDRFGFCVGLVAKNWWSVVVVLVIIVVGQGKHWLVRRSCPFVRAGVPFWIFFWESRRQLIRIAWLPFADLLPLINAPLDDATA